MVARVHYEPARAGGDEPLSGLFEGRLGDHGSHPRALMLAATLADLGGVPERPKGTGCKPVGSAYGGSNPPAPTPAVAPRTRRSTVELAWTGISGRTLRSGASPASRC